MRIFGRKNDKANSKPARTTLQFKLSMIFFGVMTVSALLSCTIIILVFGPFMKENMQSKLENMAQSIQKMEKTKKFSTDDIADIISSSSYTVKKVEKYEYEVTAYYAEIKEKGYSLSAGQYFDIKIDYVDISAEEFENRMENYKADLKAKFEESHKIEKEIMKQLESLNLKS